MRLSSLFEKTTQWFDRANAALLRTLPCAQGCSSCCIGLFPVTVLDQQEIQRGLRGLPEEDRKRIVGTAVEQVTTLLAEAPGLSRNRFIEQWPEETIDQLVERFAAWPCPALEHDGRCGLYESRPLACRSMGIPSEDRGQVVGACAVQTAVPVIRLSTALRHEENRLALLEADQLDMVRRQQGVEGEEVFLPFAFLPECPMHPTST